MSRLLLVRVFAASCLSIAPPAAAQQTAAVPAGPLTLEQALELAQGRSESVAIAQAGIRRAESEQLRARSGRYPQLSASATYDRSLANEFEGVFDDVSFGGGGEDGGFEDLPFGRANTWRVSLSLSQNLFDFGRLDAQESVAAVGRESAALSLTTTRGQLLFEVAQAYYDAALSHRLVAIAEATLDQAGATMKQAQVSFEAGTQPEFEVLRARVTRDNQTNIVIRQRINREVAMLRLKQLLKLPADVDLRLADALEDRTLAPPPAFAPRVASLEAEIRGMDTGGAFQLALQGDTALPRRTAVDEAASTVKLRESALTLVEAQRKPALSLNSTYSRIAYPSNVLPAFDRSNWSVGASLTVPILTGGRQRADEAIARTELEQAKLQLQQVQDAASLDTRSAWAELLAARAAWEATSGTIEQAERAYDIADVRYRAGVSTQLELSDSRLLLQQAEANRVQAARDLQVARARVALLPELPIGGAAPRVPQAAPQIPAAPPQPALGAGQFRNAAAQGAASQAGTQ